MSAARIVLVALASARATRFVTSDWLGEWTIGVRAKRWANYHEAPAFGSLGALPIAVREEQEMRLNSPVEPDNGWRSKLVHGLDCPFCVGFWIGGLVLAGEALTRLTPLRVLRPAWTFLLAMAGLNYVVGHVSSRIDG